jgi:hypothetical protein
MQRSRDVCPGNKSIGGPSLQRVITNATCALDTWMACNDAAKSVTEIVDVAAVDGAG